MKFCILTFLTYTTIKSSCFIYKRKHQNSSSKFWGFRISLNISIIKSYTFRRFTKKTFCVFIFTKKRATSKLYLVLFTIKQNIKIPHQSSGGSCSGSALFPPSPSSSPRTGNTPRASCSRRSSEGREVPGWNPCSRHPGVTS